MGRTATLNVSITPHQRQFVDARITSGGYESASEVVRESLRMMEEQVAVRAAHWADARAKALEGLAEAERGELTDGDTFMGALERRAVREARQHARKRPSR